VNPLREIGARLRDIQFAELEEVALERRELHVLMAINSNLVCLAQVLIQFGGTMATKEQIDELVASVAALKETVGLEEAAILAKIAELEAAQGDQPDPALAQALADLATLRNTVAGTVAGGAEPDA
jgi:hypothetical protein